MYIMNTLLIMYMIFLENVIIKQFSYKALKYI